MFQSIFVHPRVTQRHPDITVSEVIEAWNDTDGVHSARNDGRLVAVGHSASGRWIEMVAVYTNEGVVIFHAMCPPTQKTKLELRITKRRRTK